MSIEVSIADILACNPCEDYGTEEKIIEVTGPIWPRIPEQIVALADDGMVPAKDVVWVLLRPGLIFDDTTLGYIAVDIAEESLHTPEGTQLLKGDSKPMDAILIRRMWLDGHISDKEMDGTLDALYDPNCMAVNPATHLTYDAIYGAAEDPYYAACDVAAYAAAAYAEGGNAELFDADAYDAASGEQWAKILEIIKEYL